MVQEQSADAEAGRGSMDDALVGITYEQASAAHKAGQKLYRGGRVYLVRRVPRGPREGLVLWVTDERAVGDHGLVLFPDGRVETK
jgi:hypothetical protein